MKKVLLSFVILLLTSSQVYAESTYERILRTGKIRCGYNTEPPMLEIDPNSGEKYGATVDIVKRIAELLSLEIDWTEQVGWSEMTAGLIAGRYDLICNGKWIFAPQARGGQFTDPIYFTAVYPYVRVDDTRFDNDITIANSPDYKITSMDGEMNYYISRDDFPKAQKVEYPALAGSPQLILALTTKKADLTFLPAFFANDYMAEHPGKIKQLMDEPYLVFDTALMFKTGEASFAGVLDAALRQMHAQGFIDKTLDKYNLDPSVTLRVAKPYQLPE